MKITVKTKYQKKFGLTKWHIGEVLGGVVWPIDRGYSINNYFAHRKVKKLLQEFIIFNDKFYEGAVEFVIL